LSEFAKKAVRSHVKDEFQARVAIRSASHLLFKVSDAKPPDKLAIREFRRGELVSNKLASSELFVED
jgi:hypothetical protein